MLKFIRGSRHHHHTAERQKQQKQLFNFSKGVEHGFPTKPSAMAWDPQLRLLAIGTRSGSIKIYGKPGVELYGQHGSESPVTKIFFLSNQGRLIALCEDNSLHLWEANEKLGEGEEPGQGQWVLEEVKSQALEGKLKKISTCCMEKSQEHLLIGTEGGNIYLLDIKSFEMTEKIIYQDVVMQNVPDDYKVNPGAVETISEHPTDLDKILIGYNKGLLVLWDKKNQNAEKTYINNQGLESVSWHRSGKKFVSSHNDGSYMIWLVEEASKADQSITPYGPFPCKAIRKLIVNSAPEGDFLIFSGGMPRACYGDKCAVTINQGSKNVVLDFTSPVVDFLTIHPEESDEAAQEYDNPMALLVLAEEELVAVDMTTEGWPTFHLPYLAALHSSSVTCAHYVGDIPDEIWQKILSAGEAQGLVANLSEKPWPVNGGRLRNPDEQEPQALLLTGHEDGSVRFWAAGGVALRPIYTLTTSPFFTGDHGEHPPNEDQDEWLSFRKVGSFDPFSDDPRLAVKKIWMCPFRGILVVAGTAGQVIVLNLNDEETEKELEAIPMNLVSDCDGFAWKGHSELGLVPGKQNLVPGFQPSMILQISPPAAVTSLAANAKWGLVAVGTAHGFGLFDFVQKKVVMLRCTLNPNDIAGAGEHPMSRRKSFKKSLRESFRRLRKGRSQRPPVSPNKAHASPQKQGSEEGKGDEDGKESGKDTKKAEEKKEEEGEKEKDKGEEKKEDGAGKSKEEEKKEDGAGKSKEEEKKEEGIEKKNGEETKVAKSSDPPKPEESSPAGEGKEKSPSQQEKERSASPIEDAKPVERQVEARSADDTLGGMVRSLYLAESYIVNVHNTSATLWAGTNSGAIFVFTLSISKEDDKRKEEPVTCQLAKEIQLRHRAPVISIMILDGAAMPLPEFCGRPEPTPGTHRVLICSEEQFKVFTLPSLKPYGKYKVTAHEGSRLRKAGFATFMSTANSEHKETCLACLTNQGELSVFSVPDLKRQFHATCIRKEDINGILSLVFTDRGEAMYLHSPSELQRVSLAAAYVTRSKCTLDLPEGSRPPKPETKEEKKDENAADENKQEEEEEEEVKENHSNEVTTPTSPDAKGNHNISTISADITIDSIKDHIGNMDAEISVTKKEVRTEVKSDKIEESVTLIKTTTLTTAAAEAD